jgi:serine/threonine-protein kinase
MTTPDTPGIPQPGEVIAGRYRVMSLLGRGGGGVVYRAQQLGILRDVAIKILAPESQLHSAAARRFEREARLVSRLRHPNTVTLYEFDQTDDGLLYIVMEYIEGTSLKEVLQREGQISPARTIYVLRQLLKSLAEAHSLGIVHRDLKPGNLMLCHLHGEHDFVKVLDFGLVKHRAVPVTADDLRLSQTGTIHGTPSYLAPEIARGDTAVDGRADLYAVGCVAYWLLTGRLVFERETYPAMLLAHATELPLPPSQHAARSIPPALDDIVLSCLAKEPADRVPDAEDLRHRLAAVEFAAPWTEARAAQWWEHHLRAEEVQAVGETGIR